MRSQPSKQPIFECEENLVAHFARCLRKGDTPWGRVRIAFEFNYVGGLADVMALDDTGQVVAFEAKLARWRQALHQAYRTRCFANRAYIVLPEQKANLAANYAEEFRRRRVGLCSVSSIRGIKVLLDTDTEAPLQPWVAARAHAVLMPQRKGIIGCRPR